MSLTLELNELITKHLPQATGEALQKRLAQADHETGLVVTMRETIEANRTTIQRLNDEVAKLQKQVSEHDKLEHREAAVAKREHDAELAELKIRLEAAQGNTQFAKDVALGLVRNTEYRHAVFESGSMPVARDSGGGYQNVESHPTSKSTTTEQKAI